jgi:hypothetical protein
MNRLRHLFLLVAALVAVLPANSHAADKVDPLVGTWKLDVARSTFQPAPGPKGQLRVYQCNGDTEELVSRGVGADGKPTLVRYTARYDGHDYPMTGSLGGDRIELRRIDALTTQSIQKRNGQPAITATRTVSRDGKTLTVVSKGTTVTGQVIDTTLVFDRN